MRYYVSWREFIGFKLARLACYLFGHKIGGERLCARCCNVMARHKSQLKFTVKRK